MSSMWLSKIKSFCLRHKTWCVVAVIVLSGIMLRTVSFSDWLIFQSGEPAIEIKGARRVFSGSDSIN